jgi:hypothetical protein
MKCNANPAKNGPQQRTAMQIQPKMEHNNVLHEKIMLG